MKDELGFVPFVEWRKIDPPLMSKEGCKRPVRVEAAMAPT